MIKDFQKVELPVVELGNLTLENCSKYYVNPNPEDYPLAWFGKKTKKGVSCYMFPEAPEKCPKDYKIRLQFDNPMEALLEHAEHIQKEHADLSDERMKERNPFQGRKRTSRWEDEARRRGLR